MLIIFKVYLVKGINLHVGPQIGFIAKPELESIALGSPVTLDVKDYTKNTDLSLSVGTGADLPFGLNLAARS